METQGQRVLIFGAVPCKDWSFLAPYLTRTEKVICADGGVKNALAAGFTPDVAIGDWDSGGKPVQGAENVTLPAEKDLTDLQAALEQALLRGWKDVLLCACMGGPRLDHTASNLTILEWFRDRGGRGLVLDWDSEVRLLSDESVTISTDEPRYHYFSLIPLDRHVRGVTIRGAKYPIENAELTRGSTFSVSNEPLSDRALTVSVASGRLLLIRSQRKD